VAVVDERRAAVDRAAQLKMAKVRMKSHFGMLLLVAVIVWLSFQVNSISLAARALLGPD
jgi:hypothetical protein